MTTSMFEVPVTVRPLILFLVALALVGCAGTEDELNGEPMGSATTVITPRNQNAIQAPPNAEELAKQEDELQSMLDEAAMLHIKEDYKSSLAVIMRALSTNPPEPFGHRLRALEMRVRKELLRKGYLDTFARFRKDWYTIGETIEGEIVLMNISDKDVLVPASKMVTMPIGAQIPEPGSPEAADQESRSMVRSVMTYREFLDTNTVITNRRTENFAIPSDILLHPGETFRIPVTVDSSEINVAGTMYRRYRLDCSLHAVEIIVGNETFHGAVEFRGASVGVFPRNAEHLADDPMARIRQSLERQSPLHLTLAAGFLDPNDAEEQDEFAALCLQELTRPEGLPRMQDAIMCALAMIADEENTRTKEEWITWLGKRKTKR